MEQFYSYNRRQSIIIIILMSFLCLQSMLGKLRTSASAATTSSASIIGFHHSFQSRRHGRISCDKSLKSNYRQSGVFGGKSLLRASSSKSGSSSISEPLKTLAPIADSDGFYELEEIVKKSRFIGIAAPVTSWDDAKVILEQVRKQHPKSRHVCFGFISSSTTSATSSYDESGNRSSETQETTVGTERASDDGEPTGTAGQPILNAIKSEKLSDTLCIVVRYFGGIKLGAGGLIRAYGSAARSVLRSAPTIIHIPTVRLRLVINTQYSGSVYALAARFDGVTSGETYNERGELEVAITCDEEKGDLLRDELVDVTRGSVIFL